MEMRNLELDNRYSPVQPRAASFESRNSNFPARRGVDAVIVAVLLGLAVLLSPTTAFAQACPLCSNTAAAAKPAAIRALNNGILVLLVPPALMFIGIFYVAYQRRERFYDELSPEAEIEKDWSEWFRSHPPPGLYEPTPGRHSPRARAPG